jgi:hemolysin III
LYNIDSNLNNNISPFEKKKKSLLRSGELFNGISHMMGAVLAAPAVYSLVNRAGANNSITVYIAIYTFGLSLFLLYASSTIYHLLNISEKFTAILRRIDHIMIYILIAGTYTPICLIALNGWWRWGLLIAVYTFTVAGVCQNLFWFNAPRFLSTLLYIIMGWMVVIALYPLYLTVSSAGLWWLALGGISYTIGAVIYAKKPGGRLGCLGFHEIFHLFVLAGSLCHYWLIYKYVLAV